MRDLSHPRLSTRSRHLTYSFPEVETDPTANVYYKTDLARGPGAFKLSRRGGVRVPLFADLKRHDMGLDLAESTGSELDADFMTARLWGVADTAPYLHDGRATTLTEAILYHGGEAQASRDIFDSLSDDQKEDLLEFLRTLRTPISVGDDLKKNAFDLSLIPLPR